MDEVKIDHYPFEVFIPIEGEQYFEGRITLNELGGKVSAEIDIVQVETKKIYRHVDILYADGGGHETLQLAMEKLSRFLRKPH